jgi:IS30 family transposase
LGLVANTQRRISAKERETIHAGLAQGKSGAQLAALLGRDASVVNREITRKGGRNGFSGVDARVCACRRPKRAERNKIADTHALQHDVLALLATGATPNQIEVALRRRPRHDPARSVSHEPSTTLSINIHSNGMVKKELIAYLWRKQPRRSPASCLERSISANDPPTWDN